VSIIEVYQRVMQERAAETAYPIKRYEDFPVQEAPVFAAPIENVYGVPLFDIGEGFKGQVLGIEILTGYRDHRHTMPTTGYRFRLGVSVIYAQPQPEDKGPPPQPVPVVAHGIALPTLDLLRPYRGRIRWLEHFSYAGRTFDVAQADVLNMPQVMSGEAAVLVTDRTGLREVTRVSELRRLVELNGLVATLSRELQESKLREEEANTSARIAQGLAESYRSMLYEARNQMSSLLVEHAGMSGELQRVVSDLRRRMEELQASEAVSDRLKATIETVFSTVDTLAGRLRKYQEIVDEMVRRLEVAAEKPAEEAAGPPQGAGGGKG
jgi:hypothetical protein